jgi:hypothetical protein
MTDDERMKVSHLLRRMGIDGRTFTISNMYVPIVRIGSQDDSYSIRHGGSTLVFEKDGDTADVRMSNITCVDVLATDIHCQEFTFSAASGDSIEVGHFRCFNDIEVDGKMTSAQVETETVNATNITASGGVATYTFTASGMSVLAGLALTGDVDGKDADFEEVTCQSLTVAGTSVLDDVAAEDVTCSTVTSVNNISAPGVLSEGEVYIKHDGVYTHLPRYFPKPYAFKLHYNVGGGEPLDSWLQGFSVLDDYDGVTLTNANNDVTDYVAGTYRCVCESGSRDLIRWRLRQSDGVGSYDDLFDHSHSLYYTSDVVLIEGRQINARFQITGGIYGHPDWVTYTFIRIG